MDFPGDFLKWLICTSISSIFPDPWYIVILLKGLLWYLHIRHLGDKSGVTETAGVGLVERKGQKNPEIRIISENPKSVCHAYSR